MDLDRVRDHLAGLDGVGEQRRGDDAAIRTALTAGWELQR